MKGQQNLTVLIRQYRKMTLLALYLALVGYLYNSQWAFHPHSAEELRAWVVSFGVWGPLAYVGMYTVRPLLLLPSIIFNLAAGVLFPPVIGFLCIMVGGLGSASLLYGMSRSGLGETLLENWGGKWGTRLNRYLADSRQGFRRLLLVRLVPAFGYDPVSIIVGCTQLRFKTFAGATLLGVVPGAAAYSVLGDTVATGQGWSWTLALIFLAFGIPLLWWFVSGERRKLYQEGENQEHGT